MIFSVGKAVVRGELSLAGKQQEGLWPCGTDYVEHFPRASVPLLTMVRGG